MLEEFFDSYLSVLDENITSMKDPPSPSKRKRKSQPEISHKKYRLWVSFVNAIALVLTGFFTAPFTPYADTATKVYGMSVSTINLATSLFSFASLFTGIPANVIIIKLGLRKTKILANLLFTLGNALKLLVNTNVYFVHAGQLIAGLGAPFIQNAIAMFAEEWYQGEGVSKPGPTKNSNLFLERNLHFCDESHEPNWNHWFFHLSIFLCGYRGNS